MINGRPRARFGASRGLREEDPLSPFLFTLVVDVLSRIMGKAVESNVVKDFKVGLKEVSVLIFNLLMTLCSFWKISELWMPF